MVMGAMAQPFGGQDFGSEQFGGEFNGKGYDRHSTNEKGQRVHSTRKSYR